MQPITTLSILICQPAYERDASILMCTYVLNKSSGCVITKTASPLFFSPPFPLCFRSCRYSVMLSTRLQPLRVWLEFIWTSRRGDSGPSHWYVRGDTLINIQHRRALPSRLIRFYWGMEEKRGERRLILRQKDGRKGREGRQWEYLIWVQSKDSFMSGVV